MSHPDATIEAFMKRIGTAARAGGASELDVMTLRLLLVERRDIETIELAGRVQALERKLVDMPAGERREAICSRLGIRSSHYYDLREIPLTERNDDR